MDEHPRNVKDLLVELKDASELMVDLGYAALFFSDERMADEVAELVAFIRTNDDNDLVDHPAWKVIAGLSAAELEPEDEHIFDLVAVPELAAGDPELAAAYGF